MEGVMLRGDGDHPCPSDASQKIEYQARSRSGVLPGRRGGVRRGVAG